MRGLPALPGNDLDEEQVGGLGSRQVRDAVSAEKDGRAVREVAVRSRGATLVVPKARFGMPELRASRVQGFSTCLCPLGCSTGLI